MTKRITDEELVLAARQLRQSMLSVLPSEEKCAHEFSENFTTTMNRFMRKVSRRQKIVQVAQRVAAGFAVGIIGTALWLTVNASARETFFQWVREVYENSIVYEFFGPTVNDMPQRYQPTWLPEGYVQNDEGNGMQRHFIKFTCGEDVIYFREWPADNRSIETLLSGTIIPETVAIIGATGDYYEADVEGDANELLWVDESTGKAFSISAYSNKETMVRIAESVMAATASWDQ